MISVETVVDLTAPPCTMGGVSLTRAAAGINTFIMLRSMPFRHAVFSYFGDNKKCGGKRP